MRNLFVAIAAGLALSACATPVSTVRDGGLPALNGRSLALAGAQAAPKDGDLAKAVEAGLLKRLAAKGADVSGGKPPAYLLQVGVGVSTSGVGISNVAGTSFKETAWRSAPTKRRFWQRGGPANTVSAVVLDVTTGKPVAWAVVRAGRADADALADRLSAALTPAP